MTDEGEIELTHATNLSGGRCEVHTMWSMTLTPERSTPNLSASWLTTSGSPSSVTFAKPLRTISAAAVSTLLSPDCKHAICYRSNFENC